jgi:raffinose/stachyose/melibiose transport system permease protein
MAAAEPGNRVISKKRRLLYAIPYVILSILAVIQLFPLIWLLDFSLNTSKDLFGKYILKWPSPPQWGNYVKAWVSGKVPQYFVNSLLVVSATIIISTVLILMLSYAFIRMRWKLRKRVFDIILLGLMIPIHVTLLPNFITFGWIGIRDSYLGLIVPYVAFALPFGVFLLSSFIEGLPISMEESAVIDGASAWRILFSIVFPLTKPAIITIIVTTFLNSWNEFIMAAIYLKNDALRTLPFAVYNFMGMYSADYAPQFAVMALTAIPSIVIYILLNEQMTKGIMLGAVKI